MALSIPVQTTAANSADIVVTTNPVTITLVPATGQPLSIDGNVHYSIDLQKKDTLGNYYTIATITNRTGGVVWYGAGTYRISKRAGTIAFGVDLD